MWAGQKEGLIKNGSHVGLVCSVCWGKGLAELSSAKWNYRYPAILAIVFVLLGFLLLFVFAWRDYQHFDKLLVFVSTLIGSITGYYFGGERARAVVPPRDRTQENKPPEGKNPDNQ